MRADTIPNKVEYAYFTKLFTTPMFSSLGSFETNHAKYRIAPILCPYYVRIKAYSNSAVLKAYQRVSCAYLSHIFTQVAKMT